MQKTFIIQGSRIIDIASFYEEINRVFMQNEDWKLGESLDAFNDLLYGGFGALGTAEKATLIWNDIARARLALGVEATKKFYQSRIDDPLKYNLDWAEQKLTELEAGKGQTYFEILLEIIKSHPTIELIER